jgi:hypothetical protein
MCGKQMLVVVIIILPTVMMPQLVLSTTKITRVCPEGTKQCWSNPDEESGFMMESFDKQIAFYFDCPTCSSLPGGCGYGTVVVRRHPNKNAPCFHYYAKISFLSFDILFLHADSDTSKKLLLPDQTKQRIAMPRMRSRCNYTLESYHGAHST